MEQLRSIRLLWRVANYISLGQIFLNGNLLLQRPLTVLSVKNRVASDWGPVPAINLTWVHLSRVVKQHGENVLFIAGSGHGCSALRTAAFLEGTLGERYPQFSQDIAGLNVLASSFSNKTQTDEMPNIPGTIQSGYELGHSLAHAFGTVMDAPELITCVLLGDGEAETGAASAAWMSHEYLNYSTDGVVLPVVNLNGFKTASSSLLSQLSSPRLRSLFEGLGYKPYIVAGIDPESVHQAMAQVMDSVVTDIQELRKRRLTVKVEGPELHGAPRLQESEIELGSDGCNLGDSVLDESSSRPVLPMILLKVPPGWTGPKIVNGRKFEGTAVSLKLRQLGRAESDGRLRILEQWFRSYNPNLLFDRDGRLKVDVSDWIPSGDLRLTARNEANGGLLRRPLTLPAGGEVLSFDVLKPESIVSRLDRVISEIVRLNPKTFRVFSSDGTNTGLYFSEILDATNRALDGRDAATGGRLLEILSQQTCLGWLEGYLLSGRHGVYICSRQYINTFLSMLNQFAHWIGVAREVSWRKPISSLNCLIVDQPEVSRDLKCLQAGFVTALLQQPEAVSLVWFPPDAETAAAALENCLISENRINAIFVDAGASKRWFSFEEARKHCQAGIGIMDGQCIGGDGLPELVLVSIGADANDKVAQTTEIIRKLNLDLNIKVVNVVRLSKLTSIDVHFDGTNDVEFEKFFPAQSPVLCFTDSYADEVRCALSSRGLYQNWSVFGIEASAGGVNAASYVELRNARDLNPVAEIVLKKISGMRPELADLASLIESLD